MIGKSHNKIFISRYFHSKVKLSNFILLRPLTFISLMNVNVSSNIELGDQLHDLSYKQYYQIKITMVAYDFHKNQLERNNTNPTITWDVVVRVRKFDLEKNVIRYSEICNKQTSPARVKSFVRVRK